jgi:hypothetical protein
MQVAKHVSLLLLKNIHIQQNPLVLVMPNEFFVKAWKRRPSKTLEAQEKLMMNQLLKHVRFLNVSLIAKLGNAAEKLGLDKHPNGESIVAT